MNIQDYRQKLERKKGRLNQINNDLQIAEIKSKGLLITIQDIEQAQIIIRTIAQKTQQELEYCLSEIVSLALAAVFDNPYKLKVVFEIKRGKTECKILFERNNEIFSPLLSSGGGVADIAALGLRVALWKLTQPRYRNILILDEPFSRLKGVETNQKAIQMIKLISKKMNIQVIMVSDERATMKDIKNGADKVFRVSIKNGVSKVGGIENV